MESQRCLRLLWALLACYLFTSSVASNFDVGGKDGWVTTPSESYSHWAERKRFQVNDSLAFKYNKGSDSVLLVTKDDYSSCETTSPLKTMDSGSDVFQLDKSGPYFFISGIEDNCDKGQKLIVVVLSSGPRRAPAPVSLPPALSPETPSPVALDNPTPAPSKSPSPSAEPPTYSQGPSPGSVESSSAPSLAPSSTSDAPTGAVPAKSPSVSANAPYLAPYPVSMAPTGAPGPSPAAMTLVPSGPPASAPGSESSPSPSTMLPAPSQSPESPSPLAGGPPAPAPGSSIASTPSPNPKAPALAPAPPPAASWVATPSTVMVIVASFLVSSVIGVWP